MEQITVNSILLGVLTLFISLIVYVFINSNKAISKKIDENKAGHEKQIDDNKSTHEKEITELKRKQELTDAHLREFENIKFQEIMNALNGLITDVAVIKSEMVNLQKANKTG